jgi:hypothetical protein
VNELDRRDGFEELGQNFLTLNITGSPFIRKRSIDHQGGLYIRKVRTRQPEQEN